MSFPNKFSACFIGLFLLLSSVSFSADPSKTDLTIEFFLNKDGSGKVYIESMKSVKSGKVHIKDRVDRFIKESQWWKEKRKKEMINEITRGITGISYWKDKNGEFKENDRFVFKGTAYFKKVEAVEFSKYLRPTYFTIDKFTKEELYLTLDEQIGSTLTKKGAKVGQGGLSEEQSKMAIKGYLKALDRILSGHEFRIELVYHLPKKVKEVQNLKKDEKDSKTARFSLSTEKVKDGIEEVAQKGLTFSDISKYEKGSWTANLREHVTRSLLGKDARATMASGLFSGKAKVYVPLKELEGSKNGSDEYSVPKERRVESIDRLNRLEKHRERSFQRDISTYSSEHILYKVRDKEDPFTGVVYDERRDGGMLVFEVQSGKLDGRYWYWSGRNDLALKTSFKNGIPTYKGTIIYEDGDTGNLETEYMEVKERQVKEGKINKIESDGSYLWILVNDLVRYDPSNGRSTTYSPFKDSLFYSPIKSFTIDENGFKWGITDHELLRFRKDSGWKVYRYEKAEKYLSCQYHKGKIWMTVKNQERDYGKLTWDIDQKEWDWIPFEMNRSYSSEFLSTDKGLFFCDRKGLWRNEEEKWELVISSKDPKLYSAYGKVYEDFWRRSGVKITQPTYGPKGNIWFIGSSSRPVLIEYDPEQKDLKSFALGPSSTHARVSDILFIGDETRPTVMTMNDGFYTFSNGKYHRNKWKGDFTPPRFISEQMEKGIFVPDFRNGLYLLDPEDPNKKEKVHFSGMSEDDPLVGKLNKKEVVKEELKEGALPSEVKDSRILWEDAVECWDGFIVEVGNRDSRKLLYHAPNKGWKVFDIQEVTEGEYITLGGTSDRVWLSISDKGLFYSKNGKDWQRDQPPRMDNKNRAKMIKDIPGEGLWVAERQNVHHRSENGDWRTFNKWNTGLPLETIVGIEPHQNDGVWIYCNPKDEYSSGLREKKRKVIYPSLFHYEDGNWNVIKTHNGPIQENTRSIYPEENGGVWIDTFKAGVIHYQ